MRGTSYLRRPDEPVACSICSTAVEPDDGLTWSRSFDSRPVDVGRFCSERCRDAARALAAVVSVPVGSSVSLVERRDRIADELLRLWRRGEGPEPADVLFVADYARA